MSSSRKLSQRFDKCSIHTKQEQKQLWRSVTTGLYLSHTSQNVSCTHQVKQLGRNTYLLIYCLGSLIWFYFHARGTRLIFIAANAFPFPCPFASHVRSLCVCSRLISFPFTVANSFCCGLSGHVSFSIFPCSKSNLKWNPAKLHKYLILRLLNWVLNFIKQAS